MAGLKSMHGSLSRVIHKNKRKSMKLAVLLHENWRVIIGEKLAGQSMPGSISWRKPRKNQDFHVTKPNIVLEILIISSSAPLFMHQKDLLKERLQMVLKDVYIQDLKFNHVLSLPKAGRGFSSTPEINSKDEIYINTALNDVKDESLLQKLKRYGQYVCSQENEQDKH